MRKLEARILTADCFLFFFCPLHFFLKIWISWFEKENHCSLSTSDGVKEAAG